MREEFLPIKNYFAIVFSTINFQFLAINDIQTDSKYILCS